MKWLVENLQKKNQEEKKLRAFWDTDLNFLYDLCIDTWLNKSESFIEITKFLINYWIMWLDGKRVNMKRLSEILNTRPTTEAVYNKLMESVLLGQKQELKQLKQNEKAEEKENFQIDLMAYWEITSKDIFIENYTDTTSFYRILAYSLRDFPLIGELDVIKRIKLHETFKEFEKNNDLFFNKDKTGLFNKMFWIEHNSDNIAKQLDIKKFLNRINQQKNGKALMIMWELYTYEEKTKWAFVRPWLDKV
jgi:hypothetical protein